MNNRRPVASTVAEELFHLTVMRPPGSTVTRQTQRFIDDSVEIISQALSGYGYAGPWKVRPITQVPSLDGKRVHCSRVDPDGIQLRIRPSDNKSTWQYILQAPPGTSPLVLQQLKQDFNNLTKDGDVKDELRRTSAQTRALLTGAGASPASARAATNGETAHVIPQGDFTAGKPVPRKSKGDGRTEDYAESIVQAITSEPSAPSAPPPPDEAADDVVLRLLARKQRIEQFRQDLRTVEELKAEIQVLEGGKEEALQAVRKIEADIQSVHDRIRRINDKYPDPAAILAEETALKQLVESFRAFSPPDKEKA